MSNLQNNEVGDDQQIKSPSESDISVDVQTPNSTSDVLDPVANDSPQTVESCEPSDIGKNDITEGGTGDKISGFLALPTIETAKNVNTDQQKFAQLPNVTMPCLEGVVVDVKLFIPSEVDVSTVSIDYVFGKSEIEGDKLRIFPQTPGEHEIGLTYLHEGKRCTKILRLLVNQDPKKLWVKNDPPSASPFMKELYAKESYVNEKICFLAASRRGRSHEQAGTFRDDDFAFWHSLDESVYLIAVADGAGSAKYSREGSRRVVQSVVDYLSPRLTTEDWESDDVQESKDGKVAQMLISAANNALVQLDALCKAENLKPNATEKYALKDFNTTLLVAAVKILSNGSRKIVSFSIGDGAIAWVEPQKSELLCAPDGGEYSGQTRFLTTTSVWAKAATDWSAFRSERVFVKTIDPDSAKQGFLVLMTDGVSDPFFETDVKLHDVKTWDDFIINAADVDEGENTLKNIISDRSADASEKLLSWLGFWSRGNHDDRTIAFLAPLDLSGTFGIIQTADGGNLVTESDVRDCESALKSKHPNIWDRCKNLLG